MTPADLHPTSLDAIRVVTHAARGQRVVFVSGNFNIVHPGHLRLLRFAKECGDYLVVGVHDALSERERSWLRPSAWKGSRPSTGWTMRSFFATRPPPSSRRSGQR